MTPITAVFKSSKKQELGSRQSRVVELQARGQQPTQTPSCRKCHNCDTCLWPQRYEHCEHWKAESDWERGGGERDKTHGQWVPRKDRCWAPHACPSQEKVELWERAQLGRGGGELASPMQFPEGRMKFFRQIYPGLGQNVSFKSQRGFFSPSCKIVLLL